MRVLLLTLLATLSIGGCCRTRYEIVSDSRGTPEDTFQLVRAAILAERPDILYECFSEDFLRKFEVKSLREFKLAYQTRKSDFDVLARVMEEAKAGEPRHGNRGEYRFALVPVTAFGRRVTFFLVQQPWVTLDVDLGEDYGRQKVNYRQDWSDLLAVSESGEVSFREPLDSRDIGLLSPGEIHELRLHRQWFLHDIPDLPAELRGLLAPTGGRP